MTAVMKQLKQVLIKNENHHKQCQFRNQNSLIFFLWTLLTKPTKQDNKSIQHSKSIDVSEYTAKVTAWNTLVFGSPKCLDFKVKLFFFNVFIWLFHISLLPIPGTEKWKKRQKILKKQTQMWYHFHSQEQFLEHFHEYSCFSFYCTTQKKQFIFNCLLHFQLNLYCQFWLGIVLSNSVMLFSFSNVLQSQLSEVVSFF